MGNPFALDGLRIVINPVLAGAKKAVMIGEHTCQVSPAMFHLMRHANQEELVRLLESIEVVRLPEAMQFPIIRTATP